MIDSPRIPNHVIRRIREVERQESRSEFAEALTRKAAELGEAVSPSERYVARLEDGDIRYPHPAYRRVLTELCKRSITEFGFSPPGAVSHEGAGKENPGPVHSIPRWTSSTDPRVSRPSSLQQMEDIRLRLGERIGHNAISSSEIDDWELTALQHGRATRYQDPGAMLADLATDLTELSNMLAEYRSASSARRITRVIAQMSGLVCLMYIKLDDRIAFRKWARTARVAAEEAGDPLTLAWVRAHESYGYYYGGDILQAITVARHAQYVSGGVPCVGSALAAALEARALARLGQSHAREAESAIRRAEQILSNLESSDLEPSALGYTESQLRFHEGSMFTHLRNTQNAWNAQRRALELALDADYTDRTLTHLDRAICLVQDGDVSGASSYATNALGDITPAQRKGIIEARARELIRAVPSRALALPAVRDFREILATSDQGGTD